MDLSLSLPWVCLIALAGVISPASTAGAVVTWNKGPVFGPHWYPVALVVLAIPTAWAGGKIRLAQLRARADGGRRHSLE